MEGKTIFEAPESVWWLDLTDPDPPFYDRSTPRQTADTKAIGQWRCRINRMLTSINAKDQTEVYTHFYHAKL